MYAILTKHVWYTKGGFSNPALFRKMKSGAWSYREALT